MSPYPFTLLLPRNPNLLIYLLYFLFFDFMFQNDISIFLFLPFSILLISQFDYFFLIFLKKFRQ